MDFTLIKSFLAVAEESSFSLAAKHLFLSQQSLSKQIARLEEELGTELFIRSRPLRLTQNGRLFLHTAREMLKLKQEYEEISGMPHAEQRKLYVGIEHTLARAVLPHFLPAYLDRHPEVYIRILEDSPEALEKVISHEGVDLVLGSLDNSTTQYKTRPLCRKQQLLVVPKQIFQELAGERAEELRKLFARDVDLSFFEKAPFIRLPRSSSGGRSLTNYLKYYDIHPRFVCELTNVENAFQLTLSGVGILIYAKIFWDMISPTLRREYLESIEVFPLPMLPGAESVCAYYREDMADQEHTAELLALFTEFFRDYAEKSS